jgi:succinate dehydrogenase/fumarate reductase flavoprotein subunit
VSEPFDLVVVGGGTAGLACTIEAAERGARVGLVEKSDRLGGTLHVSGGHMSAAGTRRQRRRAIDDSPDLHFEDVMRISKGKADPALVRLAVDEAAQTVDWLDDLGFPFDPETPAIVYGHEPYSRPRTHWGVEGGRSILATLRPAWERHVADGRIEVKLSHELLDLAFEAGAVVGALTRGPGGDVELRGRATVLTTGGYAAGAELFAQVTPGAPPLVTAAWPTSRGDGIRIAQRAGAYLRGAEHYLPTLGGVEREPGRVHDWPEFVNLTAADRPPRELHVNARGERFLAEDDRSPDRRERALLEQPGHRFWIVFDENALAGEPLGYVWDADAVRAHSASAGDIAELARRVGINAEGLVRTVTAWNDVVANKGSDPLGRLSCEHAVAHPPFYALETCATSMISFGGVAVDGELRVVDERNEPIVGLHAAGEILGAAATSGNAFCGGMLVTPALSFGRILGRRLAGGSAA